MTFHPARQILIPESARICQLHVHAETLDDYERIANVARRDAHDEMYLVVESDRAFRRIRYADQSIEFVVYDPTRYPVEMAA